MQNRTRIVAALLALLLAPAARAQTAAPASAAASGSVTMDAVRARGVLLCGTSGTIAGFALADSAGVIRGMDADACRAIATAVLGDSEKVRYVGLTSMNRFTALQSGEVDVLVRNTGWSLKREASLGLLFASVNYWGGSAFMVKTASGIKSAKDLGGAAICVLPGTSTELVLADWSRSAGIKYTPVQIDGMDSLFKTFLAGRCDALITDDSQVAGLRYMRGAQAGELTILPERLGSEPAGVVVRKGDDKWFDIARWVAFAQIAAENLGVTSKNLPDFAATNDPDTRRLLGIEGGLGEALGLDDKWAYRVIAQVGNYGEMWDRNITPLGLTRGQNELWTKGGLAYAPPLR
jgi:general L-amino acid transport system substrate-binding protein